MKFYIIAFALIFCNLTLLADIKYDPIKDRYFSLPKSKKINLDEYNFIFSQMRELIFKLTFIEEQQKEPMPDRIALNQMIRLIKKYKTPTGKRMLSDFMKIVKELKKNPNKCRYDLLDYK